MCIFIRIETTGDDAIERDLMKIRQRLEREGWDKRDEGKHIVYTHQERPGRVVVPKGRGDLATGTARSIAKVAGWL